MSHDPMIERLTKRERQVAHLVSEGLRNKEIARRLGCTEGTIKVHLANIFIKLALSNRTQLAIYALANSLVVA